jgi:hypothetical protein
MNFAATPQWDADLEPTLVYAAQLGMDDDDLRVLSVLTTWLGVHHHVVDADRLVQLVRGDRSKRVRAYWAAIAALAVALAASAPSSPTPPQAETPRCWTGSSCFGTNESATGDP